MRSHEDLARFMKLRDTISDMKGPEHRKELLEKAEWKLRDVYVHLSKMGQFENAFDTTLFRTEGHGVLTKILQSLALLNQTYFTKGFGSNSANQDIYRRVGLPDLVGLLNPDDLVPLKAAVERLDTLLETHLTTEGVEINRFHTIEQFDAFLTARALHTMSNEWDN